MRDAYEKKILKQKVARAVVIAWLIGGFPIIAVALWWVFQLIGNISIPEVVAWALGALIFGAYFWSILKLDGWVKSVGPTIAEQAQRERRSAY
jgi:hypothetical protein